MSYDMDKLAAVVEMGEIIRLQNEAIENLKAFSKSKPYLIAPNIVKMVEENLKENVQLLYKEMNNLHKPPAEVKRHVCRECSMVFASALPGGVCDECRSKVSSGVSAYGGAMAATIREMEEGDPANVGAVDTEVATGVSVADETELPEVAAETTEEPTGDPADDLPPDENPEDESDELEADESEADLDSDASNELDSEEEVFSTLNTADYDTTETLRETNDDSFDSDSSDSSDDQSDQ